MTDPILHIKALKTYVTRADSTIRDSLVSVETGIDTKLYNIRAKLTELEEYLEDEISTPSFTKDEKQILINALNVLSKRYTDRSMPRSLSKVQKVKSKVEKYL